MNRNPWPKHARIAGTPHSRRFVARLTIAVSLFFDSLATPATGADASPLLDTFCAMPPDSAAQREDLFRSDPGGLRLVFAERLARCRSPRDVPACLEEVARLDQRVNADVIRDSLLLHDLALVPGLDSRQRSAWIEGVRAEHRGILASPSDAQAADFAAAAARFESAGALRREAIVRGSLGRCLLSIQRLDDAFDAYSRALDVRRRLGDRLLIELSLRSLGSTELLRDRAAEAIPYYEQALQIGRQRGDVRSATTTLEYLGQTYRRLNRFDKALECYEEAQQSVDAFPPAHPVVNLVQIGLAQACRDQGDSERALRILQDEVSRLAAIDEPATLRFARTQSLYAEALRQAGQLGLALEHISAAVAALDSLGESVDLARAENILAMTYQGLGEPAAALRHARIAHTHAAASNNVDDLGFASMHAGIAFSELGQPDSASACFEAALQVFDAAIDPARTADVLQHWADVLVAAGRGEEAESVLRRAIGLNERASDRRRLAQNAISLGNALGVQGKLDAGRQSYGQALDLLEGAADLPQERFGALLGLADNFELAGELDSAAVYCAQAVSVLEAGRADLPLADAHRVSFLHSRSFAYDALVQVLAELDARAPDRGHADRALSVAELARGRALLDRMHGIDAGAAMPRWDVLARPLGAEELRRRLVPDAKTVLLEYACNDSVARLWVVTSKHTRLYRLAPPDEIDHEVRRLRLAMQQSDASFIAPARRLYQLLLAPAQPELRDARVVHIVPDGSLFMVPFEALVEAAPEQLTQADTGASGAPASTRGVAVAPTAPQARPSLDGVRYALQRARVQYAPSATVLAVLDSLASTNSSRRGARRLLALGDPAASGPLPRLPFAGVEVQSIGELFPPAQRTLWTGAHAREDSFTKESASGYRFLHFATHGVVDSLVPERSHLLLAASSEGDSSPDSPPAAASDGLLQVGEIEQLHLDADLAVLSACDTGLGSVVRGEGVLGLARAFLFAGARSVVVSLWSVQDQSTAMFMSRFYRDLVVDQDRLGEAFAEAKAAMRKNKEFAHPMFWSPFILVGSGNLTLGR